MGLHAIFYTIAYASTAALGFINIYILTNLLSPIDYGSYSTSVNFAFFVGSILFAWVRFSAGRFESGSKGDVAVKFWMYCFLSMLPASTMFFCAIYFAGFVAFTAAVGMACLCASQSLFEISQEFRRARVQSRMFTYFNFARSVLTVALTALVASRYQDGQLVTITLAFSFAVAGALNILNLSSRQSWSSAESFPIKAVVSYGFGIAASGLVFSSIGVVSRLMVVHLIGLEAAGPFTVSLDLAGQIGGIVAQSVSAVVAPMIFKSYSSGSVEAVVKNFIRGAELLLATIIPTTVGLIIVSRPLIVIMTGEQFHSLVIQLFPTAVIGVALASYNHYYLHIAFQMTNRPVLQVASGAIQLIIFVVFSYILILSRGISGAVEALLVTNMLTVIVTTVLARRSFPVPIPWLSFVKVGFAVSVMAVTVETFTPEDLDGLLGIFVKSGIGFIAYLVMAFLLNLCEVRSFAFDWRERRRRPI